MTRVRPGYDWGERSDRWTGVISQVADIGGVRVHYLRTDVAGAPRDAPPHLLVHPLGAGSWSWMEVIRPLAAHGAVIVPDLPGAGRNRPVDPRAGRAEHGARFLADLCQPSTWSKWSSTATRWARWSARSSPHGSPSGWRASS